MTFFEKKTTLVPRFAAHYTLAALVVLAWSATVFAGSATWQLNPTSGVWNTAANWMPSTVPNSPTDTATFQSSSIRDVSLSANTQVGEIVLDAVASPFTITVLLPSR